VPGRPISSQRKRRSPSSEGLRITKVGLWWLVLTFVVLLAATNTGNNGLYLVLVTMLAALVVGHFLAVLNLRWLAVDLRLPDEVFAQRPAAVEISLHERSGWLARWMLSIGVEVDQDGAAEQSQQTADTLLEYLGRGAQGQIRQEILLRQRGRHQLGRVRVRSLFPLGMFRKGRVFRVDREVLVYPEIFERSVARPQVAGGLGQLAAERQGQGQDLISLRDFLPGDDPRNIHWKQTAKSGRMIFKVREAEESRRLLVLFDNAVGELGDAARRRFEHLVSEAATAALDALGAGFEVGLSTRDTVVACATGRRQRRRILHALALVTPMARVGEPLRPADPAIPHLSLAMESALLEVAAERTA